MTAFLVVVMVCSAWQRITKAAEISLVPRGHLKRGEFGGGRISGEKSEEGERVFL
jgi:hypothetical protein